MELSGKIQTDNRRFSSDWNMWTTYPGSIHRPGLDLHSDNYISVFTWNVVVIPFFLFLRSHLSFMSGHMMQCAMICLRWREINIHTRWHFDFAFRSYKILLELITTGYGNFVFYFLVYRFRVTVVVILKWERLF